jgi:hypothetical protein
MTPATLTDTAWVLVAVAVVAVTALVAEFVRDRQHSVRRSRRGATEGPNAAPAVAGGPRHRAGGAPTPPARQPSLAHQGNPTRPHPTMGRGGAPGEQGPTANEGRSAAHPPRARSLLPAFAQT